MNRRGFLSFLALAATLDPEKLLWKPGKLISIPKEQSSAILMEEFTRLYLEPAAKVFQEQMERDLARFYSNNYDLVLGLHRSGEGYTPTLVKRFNQIPVYC